jgi:hypothetical protein
MIDENGNLIIEQTCDYILRARGPNGYRDLETGSGPCNKSVSYTLEEDENFMIFLNNIQK